MNDLTKIFCEYAELLKGAPKLALREGTPLYKGRSCTTKEEAEAILRNPSRQLATNPFPSPNDGRFHKAGEFAVYFSNNAEAAKIESTKGNIKFVIVGEFKTRFDKIVYSLIKEDSCSAAFQEHADIFLPLIGFIEENSHTNDYSKTQQFVKILAEQNAFEPEKEILAIRYLSVKYQKKAKNYFLCGMIENSDLLGTPLFDSDRGFLEFEDVCINEEIVLS